MEPNTDKTEENTWRPKFKSEFSMGQFDFIRYNKWLEYVEQYHGAIASSAVPQLDDMQKLFAGLTILFYCWKVLISSDKTRNELRDKIKDAKKRKRKWEENIKNGSSPSTKFIFDFQDLLEDLYEQLMEIKQIIGLGIMVKRVMTTKEKIMEGIRGEKRLDDLPEA